MIITNRNATMNIAGLETASVATNLPYDAAGNLIPARAIPSTAGFAWPPTLLTLVGSRCRFVSSSQDALSALSYQRSPGDRLF